MIIRNRKNILLLIATIFLSGCSFQTRWGSRLTGQALELELPEDCAKVINITYEPESKSVTCYDHDNNVFSQEYSDWGVFQGRVNWGPEHTASDSAQLDSE